MKSLFIFYPLGFEDIDIFFIILVKHTIVLLVWKLTPYICTASNLFFSCVLSLVRRNKIYVNLRKKEFYLYIHRYTFEFIPAV